jgi:Raf kinase inhibitor-like YbhB/YbcL family protein
MIQPRFVALLIPMMLFATLPALAAFSVTSTTFQDGVVADKSLGNNTADGRGTPCGGQGLSPQLTWSGPPAATKSYAITMFDPEGRGGLGVSHWVLYNIPGTVTSLARGDGEGPNAKYTPGKNTANGVGYRGPCPGVGDAPHHYTLIVYALDLPPTLPAGLDREGLFAAIAGHTLGSATGMVMKYAR